jgi:hypothetical protein
MSLCSVVVATLPPAPADTRRTELPQAGWTYLDHRVAEVRGGLNLDYCCPREREEPEQFSLF